MNVVLLALYFWSRGGATTDVRIEAEGTRYTVWVDGDQIIDAALPGRPSGGIGFDLPAADAVHSLPDPAGIDHFRVTDLDTGEVLLEEAFDDVPEEPWQQLSGEWNTEDGVLRATSSGAFAVLGEDWTDYAVDATLKNVSSIQFSVRMQDTGNRVVFGMRPFRHYDSSLALMTDGAVTSSEPGPRLVLDRGETMQSLSAMLLGPYPIAILMVLSVMLLAFAVRVSRLDRALRELGGVIVSSANAIVLILAGAAFALLFYINFYVGDAVPHVPDSVLYVFQSKIFASFSLTGDAPPVRESFSIFRPNMLQVVEGRWFSHYPFGHPLFLAVGQLFHAVWLVPPVLGAASVVLIYFVGKHVYGVAVGLVAAVLLFFSPFFQMTASNFMAHNTAVFTILATLFLMVLPTKRRMLAMFFAGVFLGLLFNSRPLTATAFIPVLGVFMAYELVRAGADRGQRFREYVAFGAGGLLLLFAYFGYNQATTGDLLKSPYALQGTFTEDTFGFGGRHSVAVGVQNQQIWLAFTILVANGWPALVGLIFAALPFILGSRHRWDYFLAASFLAIASATIFYFNAPVMHGPRFWYEGLPFLILLTARGIHLLAERAPRAGDWLAGRVHWRPSAGGAGISRLAVYSLVAALVAFSAYGWMLGKRDAWPGIAFVPQKISDLEGFNFTDRRLLDAAGGLDLDNALVLVEPCSGWWCYGSTFWTNSPDLDSNVVWAERQNNEDDRKLLEHYEGRRLYLADYDSGTIRPVTETEVLRSVEEAAQEEAQRGAEPGKGEEVDATAPERDVIRRQHLEQIRVALEDYADQEGSYPDTNNQVQSLCVYREIDAACALSEIVPVLPEDPLGDPATNGYWYRSDGETYLLIARRETLDESAGPCPDDLPDDREVFEEAYCLEGPSP